jgi:hypothetical protein
MMKPPGSLPGINSFATAPTTRPTMIVQIIATSKWVYRTVYVLPSKFFNKMDFKVVLVNCQLAVGHMKANRG